MMKANLLVVEDDKRIQNLIAATLDASGYKYSVASSGREALQLISANNPEIIILDLGLPDMDGVEIVGAVRQNASTPIIVVSARAEMDDKIAALDAGADDYLTKPFNTDELLARIRVAERRIRSLGDQETVFKNGELTINTEAGTVLVHAHELHVTPIEYKLLVLLSQNVGKVLTYNTILKEVWGLYSDNIPALRVFMTTLRKKIEKYDADNQYIQTHVGVGYRMIKVEETRLP
ncbi:response regulator transcription factor [Erysipelothrix sp. HDW6C]|uniref:response regulator transcription factor n=1 Tax=Erysipelothrix sp. HDW6C TaxID=2714930 RepID=UPI00140AF2D9|nr:response regulator transcription factor [Erysipelothrix sp. HDW6C]QIK70792.1 response regulator transcription factor [Erysipelothrix sp. HDW6C]